MALDNRWENLKTTRDGFLIHLEDWSPALAEFLAQSVGIQLTPAHWEILRFIRTYHQTYQHLPNNRVFIKTIERELGADKGNSIYLNQLFDGTPVRNACLIAGLPKPPGCI